MKDRSVEFPNRYRLVKVAGTDDVFDFVPAPGEISEEGTFINKATLLKDVTAGHFGLGTDAVPDDVFGVLSRFQNGLGNEYVWGKTEYKTAPIIVRLETENIKLFNNIRNNQQTFYTEANLVNGTIVLSGPITLQYASGAGYYAYYGTTAYYLVEKTDQSTGQDGSGYMYTAYYNVQALSVGEEKVKVFIGYVNSPDPNAYPVDDGYTYTALGQLGNKVQIATGSYTGNSTYGASNPNILTFDFAPKLLILMLENQKAFLVYGSNVATVVNAGADSSSTVVGFKMNVTFSGNTVSWYSSQGFQYQMNGNGWVVSYLAIG